jgi:DNA-binding IclR family transcriptional regulator
MIQSVDRAARILMVLSEENGRLGVTELAERLSLAKGTVHGLLRTLQDHDLVEQDVDTGKYQLGPALLALSNKYLGINELRARSLAWSELLATRANEIVHVATLHGDGALIVHHVLRPDSSLQILEVGGILPLHATALGKALLANMPLETLKELYPQRGLTKLTSYTLTTQAALLRDLSQVKERGYALESEEAILGEAGIAAPIFTRRSRVGGAIGIVGPRERLLDPVRLSELIEVVIEAGRGISRDFGTLRW